MRTVQPMKRHAPPGYPTIDEIGADEFARAPARWARLKAAVASLGTVAMAMKALAQDAMPVAPATAKTVQRPAAAAAKAPAAEKQAKSATVVCPLLPVAVAGAGQGGFGCMAICPPVILSEAEALEIIEREFAKRGVTLKDGPELDGVEVPSKPGKRRTVLLDLGTEKGDLMVEFISWKSARYWTKRQDHRGFSSYEEFDLRAAAENAVAVLSKRTEGKPVTVGVLYDPVVYPTDEEFKKPEVFLRDEPIRRQRSRTLFIAQLEGIFKQLSQQGKLPE